MDPPCGAWKGELGEAELVDDGHLVATLTLQWTPAQACPDVPNVPTAACTSVLEYDFQLTMECPDECEFGFRP